jgi:replicative DNA helicase Mcm
MRSCRRFYDCWGRSTKNTIHDGGHAECGEILTRQDFSRDKVEHTLEQLKRGGEVFEPRHGLVKLIG